MDKKRVLAIYDFRVNPYTVGEILWFQVYTQVARLENAANKIDIIWLVDPSFPARIDQGINSINYHYNITPLYPLAWVNPHIGNFFVFDSINNAKDYIEKNRAKYAKIVPEIKDMDLLKRTYKTWYRKIYDFYEKNGYVPKLSCKKSTLIWAKSFFKKVSKGKITVTVQLRTNKTHYQQRNADLAAWIDFFKEQGKKFEHMFVIIGNRAETNPEIRKLKNVVFAKDYCTTVEQDIALIQMSEFFFGSCSGPGVMAVFNDKPYRIFNYRPILIDFGEAKQHPFAKENQKLIWKRETFHLLNSEFESVMGYFDKNNVVKSYNGNNFGWRTGLEKYQLTNSSKKKKRILFKYFKKNYAAKRNNQIRVVVWGTGSCCDKQLINLKEKLNIIGFVDNNNDLWGKEKDSKNIYSPETLYKLKPNVILICSAHNMEIEKQIVRMGLHTECDVIVAS